MFQSLFCWMILIGTDARHHSSGADLGFQSLFCWISSSAAGSLHVACTALRGFNPCSAGSRSSAQVTAARHWPRMRRFQSLFCWISLIGAHDRRSRRCLRPRVSILVLLDHPHRLGQRRCRARYRLARFQSLFCWITSRPAARRRPASHSDVSILVLLDHPHRQHSARCANRRHRFQSLFCWMMPHRRRDSELYHGRLRRVSILVLLDDASSARSRHRIWRAAAMEFQSLFSWMMPRRPGRAARMALPPSGFNPCSPGSRSRRHRRLSRSVGLTVSILVLLDHPPRPHRTSSAVSAT